jgi:hypothetical protein
MIRIEVEGVLFGSSISVTIIESGPSFRGITLIFRPTTSFSAKEESFKLTLKYPEPSLIINSKGLEAPRR